MVHQLISGAPLAWFALIELIYKFSEIYFSNGIRSKDEIESVKKWI